MDCSEARRLLDHGVVPGSATPERAALGFHLASCAACRAYRQQHDLALLGALLGQPEAAPPPPTPAKQPTRQPALAKRTAFRQLRAATRRKVPSAGSTARSLLATAGWYVGLGALVGIPLVALAIAGWAALTGLQLYRNVQAMVVPTATAAPAPPPTATPPPTAPPPPSATPVPTPVPTATPVPTPVPTATPAAPPAGQAVTVLLLGSDRRPDEQGPARTDAIIVARIDPQRQRVALLSLPRDLWVAVPGYGSTRINAAHVWGEIYNDPAGGIGLARATVSNLLGIPIDYTFLIDFTGFIGAIDSLGGIEVDVDKELYDARFPTMDYGYTEVFFPAGRQTMDGLTALTYSRIRHPDSDFARMGRQQAVLAGVLATLRGQQALASLERAEAVSAALRGYVKTDMPAERMLGLAWALRDFTPDTIEHALLDASMLTFGVGDDQFAEVARPGAIEQLVQHLLGQ